MTVAFRRLGKFMAVAILSLMAFGPAFVLAAGIINSATLNGNSSATVSSSATISAAVNGTSPTSNNPDKWKSTGWRIATTSPGSLTCVNTNDVSNSTQTLTFNITAPATVGIYNLYFKGFSDNSCTNDASNLLTLTNAVTVIAPDLTATKSNDLSGGNAVVNGTFTWKIRVQNSGTATATFANNDELLKDDMDDNGVSTYGTAVLSTSGTTGTIICTQTSTDNRDLKCKASGTVTMPVNSFFDVFVVVSPTAIGTLNNPRSTKTCKADSGTNVIESDENNNDCVDTVTVSAQLGTVIVKKVMIGGTDTFTFTGTPSGSVSVNNGTTSASVVPGQYISTETVPAGWDLTSVTCDDGDSVGSVANTNATFNVVAGETVTCTFTNTKRATFSLEKISDPDDGEFQFDLTGPQDFSASKIFTPSGTWNLSDLFPGLYSLSETIISPIDWSGSQNIACNGDGDNDPNVSIVNPLDFTLGPGENMSCTVNNTQDAVITGKKFEDINADGIAGEDSGLSGWAITATDGISVYPATTGPEGEYTFLIPPGTYKICETLQGNWNQSYPTTNTTGSTSCGEGFYGYELTVVAADNISGNDFGNYQNGSISGIKFEDLNGNGEKDEDELGLEEWVINLFDGTATTTTETDEDGLYEFTNLTPGTYTVSEEQQTGWTKTTEDPAAIEIQSGTMVENVDFGNFKDVIITGLKWEDLNGNGQKDESESGIPNWPVEIRRVLPGHYPVQNVQVDTEMLQLSLTGGDGMFHATVSTPGNHVATERAQGGWQQTYPVESFFDIFVEFSGQTINTGTPHGCQPVPLVSKCQPVPITFGNHKLLVISQEATADVAQTSTVITWTTDFPGTSRVIYDTVSHSNASTTEVGTPNYGYANSTATFDESPKMTSHSVTISGLTAGTTYFYRAISSASPESVGDEGSFSTPASPPSEPSGVGGHSGDRNRSGGIIFTTSTSALQGQSSTTTPESTPSPFISGETGTFISQTSQISTGLGVESGIEETSTESTTTPQPIASQSLLALVGSAVTFGTDSVIVGILVIIMILALIGYAIYVVTQKAQS